MIKMTVPARSSDLDRVYDFINTGLEVFECPLRVKMQITIVVEEIFTKISKYAFPSSEGEVTIRCMFQEEPRAVEISFTEGGIKYNPLDEVNQKIVDSDMDRVDGNLEAFLIKKSMNMVSYEYKEHKNIIKFKKLFYE